MSIIHLPQKKALYRAIYIDDDGRLDNLSGSNYPITVKEAARLIRALTTFLAKKARKRK